MNRGVKIGNIFNIFLIPQTSKLLKFIKVVIKLANDFLQVFLNYMFDKCDPVQRVAEDLNKPHQPPKGEDCRKSIPS